MTRKSVFLWRFAATAAVLLLFFAVVRLIWYPGQYFAIGGTAKLFLVLAAVNFVVGPVLTTVVYRPGKWGLGFDIRALAVVEILTLIVAGSMLYERRPYYVVFSVDRFEVVTRAEIDLTEIRHDEHRGKPYTKPRLVYAELPQDPDEHSQLIDDVVFMGEKDIDRRPRFWSPYAAGASSIVARAHPLAALILNDAVRQKVVAKWLSQQPGVIDDYQYLPLRGKARDMAMILRAGAAEPVGIIDLDPW